MALLRGYIIQDASTLLWYTEDHSKPLGDRWTHNMSEAYKFPDVATAELELDNEYFVNHYFILEAISKI